MTIGTRSVLFGVHTFWLHFLFVLAAWVGLFGFPWGRPRGYRHCRARPWLLGQERR